MGGAGTDRARWRRAAKNRLFVAVCLLATTVSLLVLVILLGAMFIKGRGHLDTTLVTEYSSRFPEKAGLKAALWGSIWICAVCALAALPVGVGTAVYLEEFARKNRLTDFIRLNISNLAGIPSIVYGILGMTVFVQMWNLLGNPMEPRFTLGTPEDWWYFQLPFGRGVLAGGLTLMLVVLPVVIVASQEALRAVPDSLREAALASGATRWQMVLRITLPAAVPTIMTGSILALSRAIGEAAPILVIAGIVFIRFTPGHLMDEFTAMPLQIYDWASRPQEGFHEVAAAGIIVLLAVLLSFNAIAVFIRQKLQKPMP